MDIETVKRVVAGYYRVEIRKLLSERRSPALARPRQMAVKLAQETTDATLLDIGRAFGVDDHTELLHMCRKIELLRRDRPAIEDDWQNLTHLLANANDG